MALLFISAGTMALSTPCLVLTLTVICSGVMALTLQNGYITLNNPRKGYTGSVSNYLQRVRPPHSRYCPYCDSSVYGYCSDKLLHDACCCLDPQQYLPRECVHADCSFLHANTCQEHSLITACCCSSLIFKK